MNSLIDNDDEFARGDRELTLSTGAILGIFLGLVLLCGLFFGFGYKMGSRKSVQLTGTEAANAAATAPTADFNSFKPAAGSPAASSAARTTVTVPASSAPAASSSASTPTPVSTRSALAAETPAPGHLASPTPVHLGASSSANPTPSPNGAFIVQIAAVSLQEDANLLAGALRSKGYTVSEHTEPDKLIHIQVGPFASRKDADAMRQRLLADGYNAIVK